jgi:hypothetical protein
MPSESTFQRVLQRLDADAFDGLAGVWASPRTAPGPGARRGIAGAGAKIAAGQYPLFSSVCNAGAAVCPNGAMLHSLFYVMWAKRPSRLSGSRHSPDISGVVAPPQPGHHSNTTDSSAAANPGCFSLSRRRTYVLLAWAFSRSFIRDTIRLVLFPSDVGIGIEVALGARRRLVKRPAGKQLPSSWPPLSSASFAECVANRSEPPAPPAVTTRDHLIPLEHLVLVVSGAAANWPPGHVAAATLIKQRAWRPVRSVKRLP